MISKITRGEHQMDAELSDKLFRDVITVLNRLGTKHTKETKEKIRQSRLGKKGKNANRWCGGNGITKDGYKYIYKPEHPNSMVAGYILEHRFIMSEHIGRPLDKNEIVHHKNQNKQDNRIKNLKIIIKKRAFHSDTIKCPYCKGSFGIT